MNVSIFLRNLVCFQFQNVNETPRISDMLLVFILECYFQKCKKFKKNQRHLEKLTNSLNKKKKIFIVIIIITQNACPRHL